MDDNKLTIEDLQKQVETIKSSVNEKDEEINKLKKELEEEKKKILQFNIAGLQKEIPTPKQEENVTFDFDF